MIDIPGMTARDICLKAMTIAADTCVYTNHNFVTETISPGDAKNADGDAAASKDTDAKEMKKEKK